MTQAEKAKISKQFEFWKNNPVDFIKTFWPNIILWEKLEEICNSVRDNRGTVVPSAHGIGKSFISAKIAIWWLFTHYPSKIITTAPNWNQVKSILWGEIRSSVLSSKISLMDERSLLETEIKLAPDWFAKGISTTERVDARQYGSTKLQGFHSKNLLVIMDEAPGVDKSIHLAIESLTVGKDNRILKIGNPTSPSGEFYNNCYSGQWNKIHISCYDHPNLKEDKEVIPGCATKEWIDRIKEEWGENSPLWKTKVLGEFPDESEDTLIPLSWIEKATENIVEPSDTSVLGVDPARFGDDFTTVYENKSNILKRIYRANKTDTASLSGRLVNIHSTYRHILIDEIGLGGGLVDMTKSILNESLDPSTKYGYKIIGINVGGKSSSNRFVNLRAEIFWYLRECLNPDAPDWLRIRIPNDDELKNQLASIKIDYSLRGQIKIESKDDMKKRGLKSPDDADGLCLAVWGGRRARPKDIIDNSIYREFFAEKNKNRASPTDFLDGI